MDMTKLIVAFHNFVSAPKSSRYFIIAPYSVLFRYVTALHGQGCHTPEWGRILSSDEIMLCWQTNYIERQLSNVALYNNCSFSFLC